MDIQIIDQEEKIKIILKGRLDTTTSPQLEEEIKKLPNSKIYQFDFQDLEYISSAGLRVLLSTYKTLNKNGGSMNLIHLNKDVMEVFEITGFKKLFQL